MQYRLPETLQSLYDYCSAKRQSGALTRYADFDMAEIPDILPHLVLLEPVGEGEDFRYLYTGAALFAAVGVDSTGRTVRDCLAPGPYLDYLLDILRQVLSEGRPLFTESSFRGPSLSNRWTSRLVVPTVGATGGVRMLVVAQIVGGRDDPTVPYPQTSEFEEGVRVLLD